MRLSELIKIAGISGSTSGFDPEITGVYADSRQVGEGSLFVAVKGTTVDGHDFIGKAIEQGAIAVVCEHAPCSMLHAPQKRAPLETDDHSKALLNISFVAPSEGALPTGPPDGVPSDIDYYSVFKL